MENHNSPEAVAMRANQEDPIVMYLVVRESLGMSKGKLCAQVGHAAMMIQIRYQEMVYPDTEDMRQFVAIDRHTIDMRTIYEKWLDTSFRKVTLGADDKEWAKVKAQVSADDLVIVIDNGLTEIPSGSETIIAVWPMLKSSRPQILKRLRALE